MPHPQIPASKTRHDSIMLTCSPTKRLSTRTPARPWGMLLVLALRHNFSTGWNLEDYLFWDESALFIGIVFSLARFRGGSNK